MVSKLYAVAFIAITTFTSCGNGNDDVAIDESLMAPVPVNKIQPDSALQKVNTVQNGPATTNTTIVSGSYNMAPATTIQPIAPATVNMNTPPATAPGMNPPHGQPGHRCDIAVGAPLNSKPAAQNTPASISAAPATVNMTPPVATAPGMNPPHGQPGHRCDISVGAPLNSKPAAAVTTTPAQETVTPPIITPVKADSVKN